MEKSDNKVGKLEDKFATMPTNKHNIPKTTADPVEDHEESTEVIVSTQSDSSQLLNYLPTEVWFYLSNKLKNTDTQNLINSSSFFRNLLVTKRTLFLYKPVLETLLPILPTSEIRSFLLSNRLICKNWSKNICVLTSRPWDTDTSNNNLASSITYPKYCFQRSETIDKFLQFFNSTHPSSSNPFIGRNIILDFADQDIGLNQEEFFLKCFSLLETYGAHITNCEILFSHLIQTTAENLNKLLCLLPNLICLKISYNPTEMQRLHLRYLLRPPNILNYAKFLKLKCLQLRQLPWFIVRQLVESNISTISVLEVTRASYIQPYLNEDYRLEIIFPKLNLIDNLKLDVFRGVDIQFNNKWPLKKIHIEISQNCNGLGLYRVFSQIEDKFFETLEHLCLDLPPRQANKVEARNFLCDSKHYRLNLAKCRIVELVLGNSPDISLNFIVGLSRTLEELTISINPLYTLDNAEVDVYPGEGREIIEWKGYGNRMYESNIWSIFPKLKKVILTKGESTRQGFQRREYSRTDWVKGQHKI